MPSDPQLLKQLQDLTAEVRKLRESMAATAGEAAAGPGAGVAEPRPLEDLREEARITQQVTNEYEKRSSTAATNVDFAKQQVSLQENALEQQEAGNKELFKKKKLNTDPDDPDFGHHRNTT